MRVLDILVIGGLCLAFTIGCSTAPAELEQSSSHQSTSRTPARLSILESNGFTRDPATTSFRIGREEEVVENGLLVRHQGSVGSVAIWKNGYFSARRRAGAPEHPPMKDGDEQNARVLAYFQAAGLPDAEIGDVRTHTTMEESGKTDGSIPATRRLVQHTSIVSRRLLGLLVAESHAWAEMDEDGKVVGEDVWWPSLPMSIADEVHQFQSQLASHKDEFVSKLPVSLQAEVGQLIIHHGIPIEGKAIKPMVTYDLAKGEARYSFDVTGRQVEPHFDPSIRDDNTPRMSVK